MRFLIWASLYGICVHLLHLWVKVFSIDMLPYASGCAQVTMVLSHACIYFIWASLYGDSIYIRSSTYRCRIHRVRFNSIEFSGFLEHTVCIQRKRSSVSDPWCQSGIFEEIGPRTMMGNKLMWDSCKGYRECSTGMFASTAVLRGFKMFVPNLSWTRTYQKLICPHRAMPFKHLCILGAPGPSDSLHLWCLRFPNTTMGAVLSNPCVVELWPQTLAGASFLCFSV